MRLILATLITLLVALPLAAAAQVTNGDFEAGGTGWTTSLPAAWNPLDGAGIDFPTTGGNPNGRAHIHSPFGNSAGEACIIQTFDCGNDPNGTCNISLDYSHRSVDASPLTGRVRIWLDGNVVHTSAPSNDQPFVNVTVSAPCGTHELRLCLEVDPGNNGWEASFDNVTSFCDTNVGVERSTWGAVKTLFQ